jgi:putative acetyltransferase
MNPTIRPEISSDAPSIHTLTAEAFRDTPHSNHTEQFIVESLRNADALSVSLVADDQGSIVGHVAVSPIFISDGSMGWYGLGPISVLPAAQGQGVGSLLMQEALSKLHELGAAGCVLLGDPAYYARFGFKPEPELVLPGVPEEYFQALSFGAGVPSGVVTYHAAFTRVTDKTFQQGSP